VEFTDGDVLLARPDPGGNFEAWEVAGKTATGDDFWLVVCLPGGGLAVW
jgi:hypothetical protein